MSQDLKKLFEAERRRIRRMPEGHEANFEARLQEAFPKKRSKRLTAMAAAASILLFLCAGIWYWQNPLTSPGVTQQEPVAEPAENVPALSLGDLSPDLRKVETYYRANINLELANLQISPENKEMAEGFMKRLEDLDTEYGALSRELNERGPNEETITAMIRNFQLRLQLLLKLKEKLNELKETENETIQNNSI